jgi:hypothetical protein
MLTRQQGQLALTHVLENLFQFSGTNPLPLALAAAGYNDIRQVITMTQTEIDALTYPDAANATISVPVPVPALAFLRILKAYHVYRHEEGDSIGDDWTSIMVEAFDTFRVDDYNVITSTSPPGYTPRRSGGAPPVVTPRQRDPVADFKKGIKRDPTLFLAFKMEKQWVSWQRSTLAQARAQDVADVLDPTYVPSLPEDKLLFEEKQKYLYAVFDNF